VRQALKRLEADGLLLLSDSKLPSLVRLVAGKPVKGSWWAHPRGKKIELRLLAYVEDVHTESGAHAKELSSWREFAKQRRLTRSRLSVARARAELERAAASLASKGDEPATLPWTDSLAETRGKGATRR
jgi:hypothetical protein